MVRAKTLGIKYQGTQIKSLRSRFKASIFVEISTVIRKESKMKISTGTIVRTVILMLALVNQVLTIAGHSPIPIADEVVTEFIATGALIITSLIAWWKNNSFTQKAITADKTFK